jgi:hypothetical protein
MHTDLISFLMSGQGCAENRAKMYDLLRAIIKNRQWALALESFLIQNFPAMLIDDSKAQTSQKVKEIENKHNVFTYYDPSLATFPRRIIFSGDDPQKQIRDFCARQFYCEWIIVEDRTYVEYIPHDAAVHKSDIPEKNWQIRQYKNSLKK